MTGATCKKRACMFFHKQETTLNHLQRILSFHEILREKHGIRLCINDKSLCKSHICCEWNNIKGEDAWGKISTVTDAKRNGGTECQEAKKTFHPVAGLPACQVGKKRFELDLD